MNLILDLPAGFVPILACGEQLIVWSLLISKMSQPSQGLAHAMSHPATTMS